MANIIICRRRSSSLSHTTKMRLTHPLLLATEEDNEDDDGQVFIRLKLLGQCARVSTTYYKRAVTDLAPQRMDEVEDVQM